VTAVHEDDYVRRIRESLARTVGEASTDRLPLVTKVKRARSTTYFFGHGSDQPAYVVKNAVLGNTAIDTTPALTTAEQFRALTLAHQCFENEDRHAAVRPLAFYEELDALAMEFVSGMPFRRTVRRVLLQPGPALRAATAGGDALRRLHQGARVSETTVNLHDLAQEVLELEESALRPVGIRLPDDLLGVLADVPKTEVRREQVLLHGDYGPNNLILMDADTVTIIDPSLVDVGLPEDDLARFLAVLSSYSIFVAEPVVPRARRLRGDLERAFRHGYGAAATDTAIMELRLLNQYVVRWRRRREFSRLAGREGPMRVRQQVIDRHMRVLVSESAARLATFLRG
jgi:aminoglycoside phosphotransferase (APT) family kinase protein